MVSISKFGKSLAEIEQYQEMEGKLKKNLINKYIFLDNHQYVSQEEIENFELSNNIKLPQDYKSFLKEHNGGYPKENCFGNGKILNFFFTIVSFKNSTESIQWHLEIYNSRYPNNFLPIASAGGGDLILLGIHENYYGKTYYWSHDFEEEDGSTYYGNIELISQNFDEFLKNLHEDED